MLNYCAVCSSRDNVVFHHTVNCPHFCYGKRQRTPPSAEAVTIEMQSRAKVVAGFVILVGVCVMILGGLA